MVNSASPLLQSSRADSAESDGSSGSNKSNKQRLTKEQKKANHINSENRRRDNIRLGIIKLCALDPELDGRHRSEGLVISFITQKMLKEIEERKALVEEALAQGKQVPEELMEYAHIDTSSVNQEHMSENLFTKRVNTQGGRVSKQGSRAKSNS